jgi:hypothetical protein
MINVEQLAKLKDYFNNENGCCYACIGGDNEDCCLKSECEKIFISTGDQDEKISKLIQQTLYECNVIVKGFATYVTDNGYTCSCCRIERDSFEEEIFCNGESDDDILKYFKAKEYHDDGYGSKKLKKLIIGREVLCDE